MSETLVFKSCPSEYAVDNVGYGDDTELEIEVTDAAGCPVDLSDFADDGVRPPDTGEDGFDPEAGNVDNGMKYGWLGGYTAKAAHWTHQNKFMVDTKTVKLIDGPKGRFTVMIPGSRHIRPGMYLSELKIVDAAGKLRLRDQRYLQIVPTLEYDNHGPITIPEVRMAIMDFPCKNSLLEDYEFTEAEVAFAIRRPVDLWNELPPIISYHTPATFPYRENWIRATVGFLFRALAARQRRNELTFQADTITMRDSDKHSTYEDLGDKMVREYTQWVSMIKVNLNAAAGFFSMGSSYGRRW